MFQFKAMIMKDFVFERQILLRQCLPEDWKLIGEDYEQVYNQFWMFSMLCLDTNQNIMLNETFHTYTTDFVKITFTACDPNKNPNCNRTKAFEYLQNVTRRQGYGSIWIYVMDVSIEKNLKDPVKYFVNIDPSISVNTKIGSAVSIELANFQVQTDVSVLPWEGKESVTGSLIQNVVKFDIQFQNFETDVLAFVSFSMTQKKYFVTRSVGKIDELFSYVGGLFSTIMAFLGWFLNSYNQYKYELKTAEGAFIYDESGRKISEQDLNFWKYVKYTIFDWLNFVFCCDLDWQDCKEIDETREQVQNKLQAQKLLRRMNNIQNLLAFITNRNQNICVKLLSPSTISQVNKQRYIQDYYSWIINGRCPLTLEDIKKPNGIFLNGVEKNSKFKQKQMTEQNLAEENEFESVYSKRKIRSQKISQKSELSKGSSAKSKVDLENKKTLELILEVMERHPEIMDEAQNIKLSQQFEEAEKKIAEAFYSLELQQRSRMQQRMPIIIIFRLAKKMKKIKIKNVEYI